MSKTSTHMIRNKVECPIVKLESGKVLIGDPGNSSNMLIIQGLAGVTVEGIQVNCGIFAAQTNDSRVLIGLQPDDRFQDITHKVHKILGAVEIRSIYLCDDILVVGTGGGIGLIEFKNIKYDDNGIHVKTKGLLLQRFACGIDMMVVSERGWGVVKTTDNRLFWFGDSYTFKKFAPVSSRHSIHCWRLQGMEFHDVSSIKEIFCYHCFIILHMLDGSVYVRLAAGYPQRANKTQFKQVVFPINESVAKIVMAPEDVFYITNTGHCYHCEASLVGSKAHPILLKSFLSYSVTNVYPVQNDYAIQCGDGSLHMLYPTRSLDRDWILSKGDREDAFRHYADGTKAPIALTFFDDKAIVLAGSLFDCTCFVTDKGHAFLILKLGESRTLMITHLTAFDTDPLAIKGSSHQPALLSGSISTRRI